MTDSTAETPHEEKQIRCPKLGHQVSFGYCRIERHNLPCQRAIACWQDSFDVDALFRSALTAEEFEEAFLKPPTPKLVTLVELIEQAKKLAKKKKHD